MLKAQWCHYTLDFNFTAITSRQSMTRKDTYLVRVFDTETPEISSVGECALFRGLSVDDVPGYEEALSEACADPAGALKHPYSSIRFGFESALRETSTTPWSHGEVGIPINGLIWMGDKDSMARRIGEKLDAGFKVLKLKIGGINFDDEVNLIADVRRLFSVTDLEIRLDANGSFTPEEALKKLDRLAAFDIHSIEQPVKAGQPEIMADICRHSPVAVALDEELIGTRTCAEAKALVEKIRPHYLILKPSLCGGFACADDYIALAGELGIGWWATSALESNVGLYAIASWLAAKEVTMPQGLGTGLLYKNNFESCLRMRGSSLWCDPQARIVIPKNLQWHN